MRRFGALFARHAETLLGAKGVASQEARLRDCLAALHRRDDIVGQRQALQDLARQDKDLPPIIAPPDAGFIISRAIALKEWTFVRSFPSRLPSPLALPAPEEEILKCCRNGQPAAALSILTKLSSQKDAKPLKAKTYATVMRELGKIGQWKACLSLIKDPSLSKAMDEVCYAEVITACGKQRKIQEALSLYEEMSKNRGKGMGGSACVDAIIRACARVGSVDKGRAILQQAIYQGTTPSAAAFDALIFVSSYTGRPDIGMEMLKHMKAADITPNEITYGALMGAFVRGKHWQQSLALLNEMMELGIFPDDNCYSAALEVCCRAGQFDLVFQLLDSMESKRLEASEKVYLNTMTALSKAGRWSKCTQLMKRMKSQGLPVTLDHYHLSIVACRISGQWKRACALLREMGVVGMTPNLACYEAAIESCSQHKRWEEATAFFVELRQQTALGGPSLVAYNSMLALCGKTSRWSEASVLLQELKARGIRPNRMSYQRTLEVFQSSGRWQEALELLQEMQKHGPPPDFQCHACALWACAHADQWEVALKHLQSINNAGTGSQKKRHKKEEGERANDDCYAAVLEACIRSARWQEALALLREMQTREELTVDDNTYHSVMLACAKAGQHNEVINLMDEMTEAGISPNDRSYLTVLKAFQKQNLWQESVAMLAKTREKNVFVNPGHRITAVNSVLHNCCKARRWREAIESLQPALVSSELASWIEQGWLDQRPFDWLKDTVLAEGRAKEALDLLTCLAQEVGIKPDIEAINQVLEALCREGEWSLCLQLIQDHEMTSRFGDGPTPNGESYRIIMAAALNSRYKGIYREVAALLEHMINKGLDPDIRAYNVAATLYRKSGAWQKVLTLLEDMKMNKGGKQPDLVTYSTTMAACAEAGHWEKAIEIFKDMRHRADLRPNLVTFGVAIDAYARGSQWQEALALLKEMVHQEGIKPSQVVYGSVLTACRNAGRWEEARALLAEMERLGVRPNKSCYNVVIDACGKAGYWELSIDLFNEMKHKGLELEPNVVTYTTIMAACARSSEHERCKAYFNEMRSVGISPNAYAYNTAIWSASRASDWKTCVKLLDEMKQAGQAEVIPNLANYRNTLAACQAAGQMHQADVLRTDMAALEKRMRAASARQRRDAGNEESEPAASNRSDIVEASMR